MLFRGYTRQPMTPTTYDSISPGGVAIDDKSAGEFQEVYRQAYGKEFTLADARAIARDEHGIVFEISPFDSIPVARFPFVLELLNQ